MFNLKTTRRALLAAATGLVCLLPFAAAAKEPVAAAPKMWVIRDADSTVYLFGSIHLLKPDMVWGGAGFDEVFDKADALYLEVADMDDQALAAELLKTYGFDMSRSLLKPYTPEEVERLKAGYAKYGLDINSLTIFKPWVAGLLLSLKQIEAAGYNAEAGVDKVLLTRARAKNLPVHGLETMEAQMKAVSGTSEEEQVKGLLQLVDEDHESAEMMHTLSNAWVKGDTATLENLIVQESKLKAPESYDLVFTQRNISWVAPVKTILNGSGTQLIVVGSGHLVGPDSLQIQLEKAGITTEAYDYVAD